MPGLDRLSLCRICYRMSPEKRTNHEPKLINLEELFGAWQDARNRQNLSDYMRKHQWDDVGSVVKHLNNLMGFVHNANFHGDDMMAQAMRQLAGKVGNDIMADMLRVRASDTRSKQSNFDIPSTFLGLNNAFAQGLLLTQSEWRRTGVDAMGLKFGTTDQQSRLYVFWQRDNVMTRLGMFDASDLILRF